MPGYALGTSAIALGFALGSPAAAQCAPDPTVANGITNCTGTDADGLTVTTDNTRVTVAAGAVVRAGNASAAISPQALGTSLSVAGLVDGGVKPGIFITNGAPREVPCDPYAGASPIYCVPGWTRTVYPSSSASISVAEGGTVSGGNAILLRRDPANTSGSINATVDNAGTISGAAGEAILASDIVFGELSITNASTGRINGGIAGRVSMVTNAGSIDGGARAAIAGTMWNLTVVNTGSIVSSGAPATLSGTGRLSITNAAGAMIGGSPIAIRTADNLSLTNNGTINGSVISTLTSSSGASFVDTRNGTINGDLLLGGGSDTLYARYDAATGLASSITGTIDGGAGTDTLAIDIDADTTIAHAVLPTNFELLGLTLSNDAAVTITPGFTSGGLTLSGSGTVINQAALVTQGPAVGAYGVPAVSFTNQGSITATLGGSYQRYAVLTPRTVNNEGTVTAIDGNGVRASESIANSGTITATQIAVSVDYAGTLTNSGTIRSTAGIGASLSYSGNSGSSTNSGTIEGAAIGVQLLGGRFNNTGTIIGGTTGVHLIGTLNNAAEGTITGATAVVGSSGSPARIINAGTINGNVDFSSPYGYDYSSDLFIDDGGIVNGAILLGGGNDTLVVALGGDPTRPLAGATGGVDAGAGYDTLRYLVNADAEASLALVGGFEGLAYELADNAALTLTAASPIATTIGLAGNGTVTLNGALSTTDRSVVDTMISTVAQLTGEGTGPEHALSFINNGDLTLTTSVQGYVYNLAAINAGTIYASTVDITNNGTITVTNAPDVYYPAAAILGGSRVANAGTITLSGGGTAISGAQDVENSGTITVSGNSGLGITGFDTLANSGTIRADNVAVQGGYGWQTQITNTGTIESLNGTAVVAGYYGSLVNEAGGTIRGVTAIDLSNGMTVTNRGTIIGNVSASFYGYGATYVADGGTLTGNLSFGSGNDTLILFGETTGISGTIDGGAGTNTLIHARRASGTVTLGSMALTNFRAEGIRALGSDTQATVRADGPFVGDLALSGDGAITNTAAITGLVQAAAFYQNDPTTIDLAGPLAFTNEGTIEGGFTGPVRSFANRGTITGTRDGDVAVGIQAIDTLAFDNSGSISNGDTLAVSLSSYDAGAITAANSGTITGGFHLGLQQNYLFPGEERPVAAMAASLTNSGRIATSAGAGVSITIDVANEVAGHATLINSGTIEGSGENGLGAYLGLNGYYGPLGSAAIEVSNAGTIRANGGAAARSSPTGMATPIAKPI
ncbi:hypothetical protein XM50_05460 [Sphingomonas sp. Ag1]|nr:hypothetical protein XM50_05460 [Sphingomonas sp. Ag1]